MKTIIFLTLFLLSNHLSSIVFAEDNMTEMDIEVLGLSKKIYNRLILQRIYSIPQLVELTEEELLGIFNLGPQALQEIKDKLANITQELKFEITDSSENDLRTALNCKPSICRVLAKRNINTVEQLTQVTKTYLLNLTGLGEATVNLLEENLAKLGKSLKSKS